MTLRVAVPATCTNTPAHNFSGQHLTACPLDPFVHACMPASRLIPDCLFMFPRPEGHVMWMGLTSVWTPVKRPSLMTSISDTVGYSMELEILVNGCVLHTRARTWRHWWTEQADEDVSLIRETGCRLSPRQPPWEPKNKKGGRLWSWPLPCEHVQVTVVHPWESAGSEERGGFGRGHYYCVREHCHKVCVWDYQEAGWVIIKYNVGCYDIPVNITDMCMTIVKYMKDLARIWVDLQKQRISDGSQEGEEVHLRPF